MSRDAAPRPGPPELACVVLSLGADKALVDAVRSLADQQPRPEIVVVNSGGGDAEGVLRPAGLDVPVITQLARATPGAVRNLGIRSTRAPYVAFLAADCLAEPDWVANRLRLHQKGERAVASIITNPYPKNPFATAVQLFFYFGRMKETPVRARKFYGVSYERTLFERFGLFREDLDRHEDGEFNRRISRDATIAWAPDVRTAHRHPTRFDGVLHYCFERGAGEVRARRRVYGRSSAALLVGRSLARVPRTLITILRTRPVGNLFLRLRAWPLVASAAFAYVGGTVAAFITMRSAQSAPLPPAPEDALLEADGG